MDGSGKSTLARRLVETLEVQGIPAKYVYLRTPHFVSKPLMGLCRLTGVTERIWADDGSSVRGFHHFYRSRYLTALVPWLQAIDMHLFTWKDVWISRLLGHTVVCDRYVTDTMTDMIVETKRLDLPRSSVGRLFMAAIPRRATRIVVLVGDPEVFKARKNDLEYDRWIEEKTVAFLNARELLNPFQPLLIDSAENDLKGVWASLLEGLAPRKGDRKQRKWAKAVRYLLAQGFLYADRSERVQRLLVQALLTSLVLAVLRLLLGSLSLASVLAALVSGHLGGFIFNGSFWSTLACDLKLTHPVGKTALYEYLFRLRQRLIGRKEVSACFVFGSIARQGFHNASDLDMLVLRNPGFGNAISSFWFTISERLFALWHRVPLELWIADSPDFFNRLRSDEAMVVIADPQGVVDRHYRQTQTIEEAIESNGDNDLFKSTSPNGKDSG